MRYGIKFKLLIYTVALLIVASISVASYAIYQQNISFKRNMAHSGDVLAQTLSKDLVLPVMNLNITKINQEIQNVITHNNISKIFVTDPNGTVITDGSTENQLWNKKLPGINKQLTFMDTTQKPLQEVHDNYIMVFNPIRTYANDIVGILAIKLSLNTVKVQSVRIGEHIFVMTLILLILASVVATIFANLLIQPLFDVIEGMKKLGKRDFDYRLPEKRKDEIGLLAHNLNLMADELKNTTVSKEHLDNIVNLMGDMLFVIDQHGIILEFNARVEKLMGYHAEELLGTDFIKLSPDFNLANTLSALERENTIMDINRTFISKNGDEIHVLISKSILDRDDSSITEIILVAQDLTRVIELENEKHQSLSEMCEEQKNSPSTSPTQ